MFRRFLRFFARRRFISCIGRITSYGYPGDTTPDSNSTNAIGAWDNKLSDGKSLAVSRDIEEVFSSVDIYPKQKIRLVLDKGDTIDVTWDDRTAKFYKGKPLVSRFDLYCAHAPSPLVDRKVLGFEII